MRKLDYIQNSSSSHSDDNILIFDSQNYRSNLFPTSIASFFNFYSYPNIHFKDLPKSILSSSFFDVIFLNSLGVKEKFENNYNNEYNSLFHEVNIYNEGKAILNILNESKENAESKLNSTELQLIHKLKKFDDLIEDINSNFSSLHETFEYEQDNFNKSEVLSKSNDLDSFFIDNNFVLKDNDVNKLELFIPDSIEDLYDSIQNIEELEKSNIISSGKIDLFIEKSLKLSNNYSAFLPTSEDFFIFPFVENKSENIYNNVFDNSSSSFFSKTLHSSLEELDSFHNKSSNKSKSIRSFFNHLYNKNLSTNFSPISPICFPPENSEVSANKKNIRISESTEITRIASKTLYFYLFILFIFM
jgi:hypothetical protein